MRTLLIIMSFTALISCNKAEDNDNDPQPDYRAFTSFADFTSTINRLATDSDKSKIDVFWDSLVENHQVPFIFEDSVAFLYKGQATSVQWAGDFNGWDPGVTGYTGTLLGNGIWLAKQSFPKDARLDYKLVIDGYNWITDSNNPYVQYSGFGPNSELRMPEFVYPEETILISGAPRGTLSSNITINSDPVNLGYKVQYRVYTPYNYEHLSNLPVIYVTDGPEYFDDRLGAFRIVLDNIIHQQKIEPVIAVFIDARDPDNLSSNRRMTEYAGNIKYANFVADELVPVIDAEYKTNQSPDKRAILGTSMGGWNAGYFGLKRSDTFHLIGIHSPAFDNAVIDGYNQSPLLPLRIFMSTGVIHDTQVRARQMRDILLSKQYQLNYIEVNQGHSWGNWKGLTEEPLVYFFGSTTF